MEVKKTLSQKSFRMQILRPHRLLIPITMKIVAATPKSTFLFHFVRELSINRLNHFDCVLCSVRGFFPFCRLIFLLFALVSSFGSCHRHTLDPIPGVCSH